MGNRAVITTNNNLNDTPLQNRADKTGIYLHWNGGRDSVEGFLAYCKLKKYRGPDEDESYCLARLVQVIANFFDSGLSVGVGPLNQLDCDNYDNGVYVIGKNWKIVDRKYYEGEEQHSYSLLECLRAINKAQPQHEQLPDEELVKFAMAKSIKKGE